MTNPPKAIALDREAIGSDRFDVSIDRDAEVPIGVQLAWALRARIQGGGVEPGQRLPTLRELAEATGVNINTVRSVYQRLDQEGLIDSLQGSGTFVASTRPGPQDVATIVADAARAAHETGIDPREVAAALYVSSEFRTPPSDPPATRRRTLRTDIAVLERAIGEIEASHPGLIEASTATRPGPGPTLLGVEELERVRTQLVRRLATVQSLIDGHLSESAAESASTTASEARAASERKRKTAKPKAARGSKAVIGSSSSKRPSRAPGGPRPAPAGT